MSATKKTYKKPVTREDYAKSLKNIRKQLNVIKKNNEEYDKRQRIYDDYSWKEIPHIEHCKYTLLEPEYESFAFFDNHPVIKFFFRVLCCAALLLLANFLYPVIALFFVALFPNVSFILQLISVLLLGLAIVVGLILSPWIVAKIGNRCLKDRNKQIDLETERKNKEIIKENEEKNKNIDKKNEDIDVENKKLEKNYKLEKSKMKRELTSLKKKFDKEEKEAWAEIDQINKDKWFPSKYLNLEDVKEFIDIFSGYEADNVKEAIRAYKDRAHKRKIEGEVAKQTSEAKKQSASAQKAANEQKKRREEQEKHNQEMLDRQEQQLNIQRNQAARDAEHQRKVEEYIEEEKRRREGKRW